MPLLSQKPYVLPSPATAFPEKEPSPALPTLLLMVIFVGKMTLGHSLPLFNPREDQRTWCFEAVEGVDELEYHFRLVVPGRLRKVFGGAGLIACACVLWLAPGAAAQSGNQDSGVYDQYTEQIPTADGPHNTSSGGPTGPGSGGTTGTGGGTGAIVLPANLNEEGGKDAQTLREVATSPRFGAPDGTLALPESSSQDSTAGLSAAVNAVTDGSDGRMVGLFVALLAVTAVSVGIAAARRRSV
jgi:hypothetical protein